MRKSRRRLMFILLGVMTVLLVVGVAAGVAFLLLRQPRPALSTWKDPVAAVVPDEVAADLALYPLAGASALEAIDTATETGELMSALAMLSHSVDIADRQRIGRIGVLGALFSAAAKPDMASIAYQEVYDLAVLSPRINDPLRVEALRVAGEGWAAMHERSLALGAYEQIHTIAIGSPYLQASQRREMLSAVEQAYIGLSEKKLAQSLAQEIRELDEEPPSRPAAAPGESAALPFGSNRVSSAEVGTLEDARRKAAYALISSLGSGQEPASGIVNALADALKVEDAAKFALYEQELAGTSQSSRRIDIHWERIRWLLVKYQIAAKAFGRSLVPEWEPQLPEIQSTLSKAYEDLLFDYEDLAAAQPNAAQIGPGRYDARRLITLAGRLGQYPNFPVEQLAEKLQAAATDQIAATAGSGLYVDVLKEGMGTRYVFRPAATYGQATPAP